MIIKKMYINGQWVDAVSGKTRNIENPGNEEIIARVPEGDRSDAKAAIAAAREAFDKSPWRITTGRERGLLLYRLADAIESSSEELAELESLNTGKTVEESRWDMNDIAGIFRYYAGLADKEGGETLNLWGYADKSLHGTTLFSRQHGKWPLPWQQGAPL